MPNPLPKISPTPSLHHSSGGHASATDLTFKKVTRSSTPTRDPEYFSARTRLVDPVPLQCE
jgi:hypothetical protein